MEKAHRSDSTKTARIWYVTNYDPEDGTRKLCVSIGKLDLWYTGRGPNGEPCFSDDRTNALRLTVDEHRSLAEELSKQINNAD